MRGVGGQLVHLKKGGRKPKVEGKETESRKEEKLLNAFLKLLKTVRYEAEPFSICSCDFGTKRKKKTPSKWPRILTPAAKEI
jgi:hypothetical protein